MGSRLLVMASGLWLGLLTAAFADFPEQPIKMVIPYGAGGATDISARTIAEPLGAAVGQPLTMENVTGDGGAAGSLAVGGAEADGYTMLFARVGSHSVNPAMKAALPYAIDDFRFVAVYEINPVACAVRADSDIASIEELAATVGEGVASYSSSGVGSLPHLAAVAVLHEFAVDDPIAVTHVPREGGGAAAKAVVDGAVTFLCANSSSLADFVANGELRALLVTTAEPVVGFNAPTSADVGKPALQQVVGWTGIAGPAGLPDDVTEAWHGWIAEATADRDFVEEMTARGSVIRLMDPDEAHRFVRDQYETFRTLVDELGMRIEN